VTEAQRAQKIRLILCDVDGVLTDGGLYYGADGELLKRFNVKDGHGLVMWRLAGGRSGVLTARRSAAVEKRAAELQMSPVLTGHRDKRAGFQLAVEQSGLAPSAICYVGDELNDLGPLQLCGLAACPADAVPEVKQACHLVLDAPGGHGAIRELVEHLMRAQGTWTAMVERMRSAT